MVLPALPLVMTAPTLMWQPTACSAVAEHGTTMLNAAYSEWRKAGGGEIDEYDDDSGI